MFPFIYVGSSMNVVTLKGWGVSKYFVMSTLLIKPYYWKDLRWLKGVSNVKEISDITYGWPWRQFSNFSRYIKEKITWWTGHGISFETPEELPFPVSASSSLTLISVMTWSFVTFTLLWAFTQSSQRYSSHSSHIFLAMFWSSQLWKKVENIVKCCIWLYKCLGPARPHCIPSPGK